MQARITPSSSSKPINESQRAHTRHFPSQRPVKRIHAALGVQALIIAMVPLSTLTGATETMGAIPTPPGHRISVGSQRFHLHCQGEGTPLVILEAGLGGTSLDWVKVQPKIARHTKVCSYDRAGYGWSDPGIGPRTASNIARDLKKLLIAAQLPPPYLLVGHSFGALSSRVFIATNRASIAGLVMIDPTPAAMIAGSGRSGDGKILLPHPNRAFVINNHGEIPSGLPDALVPIARQMANRPRSIRSLYSELRHLQISAIQTQSANPTLVQLPMRVIAHDSLARARDAKDRHFAQRWLDAQRAIAALSAQGELIITGGSGHHVHLDEPQFVVGTVVALLDAIRSRLGQHRKNQK